MSHPGSVDIIDFVLLTLYPVGALFIIEILTRAISRISKPVPSWLKLSVQGVTMVGFTLAYIGFMPFFTNPDKAHNVEPHTITAFCLLALAGALFFQARRAKINPEKSLY
jgi:energy-converting hydrogenase Eha subunit G